MNGRKELIDVVLQNFSQKQDIKIRYATLYMHKENSIAKLCQKTLIWIINLMLIDNQLLNQLRAETMDITNYWWNWLPIKYIVDMTIIILEKNWIEIRHKFKHIPIFSCMINILIPIKKCSISNIYKIRNKIFLRYINIIKIS